MAWIVWGAITVSAQPPLSLDSRPAAPDSQWQTTETSPIDERPLPARPATGNVRIKSNVSRPSSLPLWGTVAGLALLAAGLACAARWIRRHGPAVLRALPDEAVEPLGQRALSRGVTVHLVRCGQKMLLLGVGPDGVRTLSEITDPVEVDLLAGACRRRDEASPGMAAFAQLLQRSPNVRGGELRRPEPARFPLSGGEVDHA